MASKWEVKFDQAKLREAKQVFKQIAAAIDPALSFSLSSLWKVAQQEVQEGFRAAAILVRDKARANAAIGGVPRRLFSGPRPAIFAFTDFQHGTDDKRKRSALVGIRTGAAPRKDKTLYVEWGRKGRGLKGISLARIFESGTHRGIRPRRFFRSAVFSTRSAVARMVTQAYYRAIATLNRNQ